MRGNLTEHQRQHIIELLEAGEDLPLDYKHLLFPPERKEYELMYASKEREEDILAETMAVPFQPIKTFGGNGDPSAVLRRGSGQGSGQAWRNMLIFGDNLQAMKTLLQWKEDGMLVNSEIEKNGWEVHLPLESLGRQAMIIYMDIYGNEYREIKTRADFSGG